MKLAKGSRMRAAIERIVSAHGKMEEFIQGEDFHLRIENPPFLPLIIERHGASASVTHYFEQNGDLIPDPDMEFTITNSGEWFPVATQFATGHYRRAIFFEEDKKLGWRSALGPSVTTRGGAFMENKIEIQKTQRKLSTQMRAVLTILSADSYLMGIVEPHINLNTETIHWDPIFKFPWCSGHRACVVWAYSLWTDEIRSRANPFDAALSLSPKLQIAVLKALSIRWGLPVENEEIQNHQKGA